MVALPRRAKDKCGLGYNEVILNEQIDVETYHLKADRCEAGHEARRMSTIIHFRVLHAKL